MRRLPKDLLVEIHRTFPDADAATEIAASLDKLWDRSLNVGPAQLARAIVFLAKGDLETFSKLRRTFLGDPRDLLVSANRQLVNKDYWFSQPFSEMGPLRSEP